METANGTVRTGPFAKKGGFNPLHLLWMVPAGAAVVSALFFGLGHLLVWLWRVTVVDIFGVKAISFWQAWGLLLLCQLLFKANVTQNVNRNRRAKRATEPPAPSQP
jgi:hypothetical protein